MKTKQEAAEAANRAFQLLYEGAVLREIEPGLDGEQLRVLREIEEQKRHEAFATVGDLCEWFDASEEVPVAMPVESAFQGAPN